jgi:hypothetical protein
MKMRITVCIDCSEENSNKVLRQVKDLGDQLALDIDEGKNLEPDEHFNFDWCIDPVKNEEGGEVT